MAMRVRERLVLGRYGAGALVTLCCCIFVATASASSSAVRPFDRHTARPGQTISVTITRVVSTTPTPAANSNVRIYLLPMKVAARWWPTYNSYGPTYGKPPKISSARLLGELKFVLGPAPHLRATLPSVQRGEYVLAYWAPASNARWTSALPNLRTSSYATLTVIR